MAMLTITVNGQEKEKKNLFKELYKDFLDLITKENQVTFGLVIKT